VMCGGSCSGFVGGGGGGLCYTRECLLWRGNVDDVASGERSGGVVLMSGRCCEGISRWQTTEREEGCKGAALRTLGGWPRGHEGESR